LARHLISLHFKDEDRPKKVTGALDAATLTEFISYARTKYMPVLSDEAAEMLVEGYVDMRRMGGSRKAGRHGLCVCPPGHPPCSTIPFVE